VIERSSVQYAQSGDVHVAYEIVGGGDIDLVLVQGFVSHLDLEWDNPHMVRFLEGLASFARLILFDKRGTGLSDRSVGVPTLEERMDDVRAVMDAAGSERAVVMGVSEGAPMSILFAATHPDRTRALVLHGGMARTTEAPDYPWASPAEALVEAAAQLLQPILYTGEDLEVWAPSLAEDRQAKDWLARYRRAGISPDGLSDLYSMFLDIDVRDVLPTLRVPTLVLHRHGDRVVNWRAGGWTAERIPGARFIRLEGQDHFPWSGDEVVEEIREFLTGVRVAAEPDRVLATVMFTDVAASTERAAALGDHRLNELLDAHDAAVRHQLEAFRGREVKTTGDGFLATFDDRRAPFDARPRSAPRRESSLSMSASVSTPARSRSGVTTSAGSPCTSDSACRLWRSRPTSWCRAPSRTSWPAPESSSTRAASTSSRVCPIAGACSR
jgi:pimeloyl-ACP methyl ester carboxylesterase